MSDLVNALQEASGGGGSLPKPVVVNPLAAMQGAAQTAQSVYGVREKQAQQAVGDILQQATGPDGTIDYPKAQALAARAGPIVQMGMASFLKDASALKGAQMQQGVGRNAAVGNAIVGALTGDDAGLHDRVAAGLRGLIANGVMTPDEATKWALTMPNDPAQIRQRLEQLRISLAPPDQQETNIYGTRGTINTGTGTQGVVQAPASRGGGITPGGAVIPHGLTPEQEAEIVEVTDTRKTLPDGSPNPNYNQKVPMTRGDLLRSAGIDPRNPGGVNTNLGTGRPPPALVNPNGPKPAAPATPAPRTLPAPPTKSDQDLADKSGARFQADIDQGTEQNTTLATLSTMQSDINRFVTGSGAAKTLDWKRAVQSWAPGLARMAGIKSDEVAAQESFQKAVAMIVGQQSRGTDKGQELQMHATPGDYLSPEGADSIIRQLQGNADYIQARARLAQAWPNRTDYGGFSAKLTDLDPRYFQYERLTPEQKTAYFNGLPEKERNGFKTAYGKTKALIGGG